MKNIKETLEKIIMSDADNPKKYSYDQMEWNRIMTLPEAVNTLFQMYRKYIDRYVTPEPDNYYTEFQRDIYKVYWAIRTAEEHFKQQCTEENGLYEVIIENRRSEDALRLLLDWAIECGFGLDNFPEEYEKYKHTLTDDMDYTDMLIQVAKCVIEEREKIKWAWLYKNNEKEVK